VALVITFQLVSFIIYAQNDWYIASFANYELGEGRLRSLYAKAEAGHDNAVTVLKEIDEAISGAKPMKKERFDELVAQLAERTTAAGNLATETEALVHEGVAIPKLDSQARMRIAAVRFRQLLDLRVPVLAALFVLYRLVESM
jgi:hypothetical protein